MFLIAWIIQIKAAAALSGLTVDHPASYVHYEDNKKPEYLAKFASGKIPAFEDKDGFTLFEGTAIARYGEGSTRWILTLWLS
jgi:elongation factor 1-gamma